MDSHFRAAMTEFYPLGCESLRPSQKDSRGPAPRQGPCSSAGVRICGRQQGVKGVAGKHNAAFWRVGFEVRTPSAKNWQKTRSALPFDHRLIVPLCSVLARTTLSVFQGYVQTPL